MASKRQTQQRRTRAQRRAAERAQPRQRTRTQQRSGPSRASLIGGVVTALVVAAILAYAIYQNANQPTGITSVTAYNNANFAPRQLPVGTQAPNFTLKDVNGKKYTLSKQRGHPVLLEFFAVWCPVCQGEAPTIAQITNDYVSKGVRVWSILANPYGRNYEKSGNTDTRPADKGDLSWFAQNFNVQHPQLIDPNYNVVGEYGIQGYPGLYVIDKTGKIIYSQNVAAPYSTLSAELNKALGAKGSVSVTPQPTATAAVAQLSTSQLLSRVQPIAKILGSSNTQLASGLRETAGSQQANLSFRNCNVGYRTALAEVQALQGSAPSTATKYINDLIAQATAGEAACTKGLAKDYTAARAALRTLTSAASNAARDKPA
jgi:peroxiredoxin